MIEAYLYDGLGTLGVIIILVAYTGLQIEKMDGKSFLYSFLNLLGAILILISLIKNFNLPSFIIEICWIIISVIGMIKSRKTSK